MMQRVWHNMGLSKHYANDFEKSTQVMKELTMQIELLIPRLADKLKASNLLENTILSLYVAVLQNFGFTGQDCLISMESAMRLFEYYIFNNDEESIAMTTILIYML